LARTKYSEDRDRGEEQLPVAGMLAIVGRPNVGKSTLFNRLVGQRRAIVGDEPGITRDRLYGYAEWIGKRIRVVDTGGIVPDDEALIPSEIFRQAKVALEEADVIVMVVDARTELASSDIDLARLLQRLGKPLILAVNKVDDPKLESYVEDFRRLGIKNMLPISAEHATGVAELLEEVLERMPGKKTDSQDVGAPPSSQSDRVGHESAGISADLAAVEFDEDAPIEGFETPDDEYTKEIKIAIIGRPNVGKSTLLNLLTGSSRAIVSPIAGTTRDAVDELIERDGQTLRFIDTAGIRRKGKTHLMAEKLSVVMARKHLEAADIALIVIDATEGVTALDATIAGYAHEAGRSVIILVNKWDAVTIHRTDGKPAAILSVFEEQVRDHLKFLAYAPVIFTSGVTGYNTEKIFEMIDLVGRERRKRIGTGEMNRFLKHVDFERASVPYSHRVRIYYMTQAAVSPPTFILFTDRATPLHFAYRRFLENQIREAFQFVGTPIWIKSRPKNADRE
jgi:GTP-binding protein